MKTYFKIIRGLLIAALIMAVVVPTTAYVMLSTSWANERLKRAGEEALQKVLGVEVQIERVRFSPFNRMSVTGLTVIDDLGEPALRVKTIAARIELADFLFRHNMIIDYAVVDGLDGRITRPTPDGPLNIQTIVDKFSQPKPKREAAPFAFQVNNVELLRSRLSYDVLSEPLDTLKFDANHIQLSDIDAVIHAPLVSTEAYGVRLRRLNFKERSGFEVDNIQAELTLSPEALDVGNLEVDLPNSVLAFGDIAVNIDGIKSLRLIGKRFPVELELNEGSHVFLPDLKAFDPRLGALPMDLAIDFDLDGTVDSLYLHHLSISEPSRYLRLSASGGIAGVEDIATARIHDLKFRVQTYQGAINEALRLYATKLPPIAWNAVRNAGNVALDGTLDGTLAHARLAASLKAGFGSIDVKGTAGWADGRLRYDLAADADNVMLGRLIDNPQIGAASVALASKGTLRGKSYSGSALANINLFEFKSYPYRGLAIEAALTDTLQSLTARMADPNATFDLDASLLGKKGEMRIAKLDCNIGAFDPSALNLWDKYEACSLSANIAIRGMGYSPDQMAGSLDISNLLFIDPEGIGLHLKKFSVDADNLSPGMNRISIVSDVLNGSVEGKIRPSLIALEAKEILYDIFPNIVENVDYHFPEETKHRENNFAYDFTIDNAVELSHFLNLPVTLSDPVSLQGEFSSLRKLMTLALDAPWLLQGNKLIENTALTAVLDGAAAECDVYLSSLMPTKKGPMEIVATIDSDNGKLLTNLDWQIIRQIPINGNINFSTQVMREYDGTLATIVQFNPGQINFGEEVWQIMPSEIQYFDKTVVVQNFALEAPTQKIKINGVGSESSDDVLVVNLDNIQLLDIFETLDIDKALICGSATGVVYASKIFTPEPEIRSEGFHVKNIGYNSCVLGDADIVLGFDNENKAFTFDADIIDEIGRKSVINGFIVPATEELDLQFDADHVKVGFMRPFMEAFCDDVAGYATGKAHLYGTFKYIDMTGDIQADSLQLKIGYTNTWYHASCNIPLRPGVIDLDNITIYDTEGNSALLNGYVKHTFFKEPVFKFDITNARDFLCYDVRKNIEHPWYGKIYGSGSAYVYGEPGLVDISVDMTTAPKSIFTFELSDQLEAEEFSFITFKDVTPVVVVDSIVGLPIESYGERWQREHEDGHEDDKPSDYHLSFQVDITPDATIVIVMDPAGGDEIRAHGDGHMRMTYGSVDNNLAMYGDYILERGTYDFTLQSLIFRKFTIRSGSSISFKGDPYNANLDITAIYNVKNANLSDLDESFLNDKDLNRTNVPVNAVLMVTGEMMQPSITFDLEFPSLNQDAYRKVRSIVSTDDMMSRQIIYLLALNRFYTPEYMEATKGNNLFSVASSTISSQLSSVLGKLSDNWSIAPNLRSDRGDFSDLEVDLSLSSTLLNNRLLLNGNFGYRDKSLNTNQFVGDFDAEYLLNRSGTLRLKAYNRYNDQNYYLRTAQTTQGVGIVLKHDFDRVFDFLHKRKSDSQLSDTTKTAREHEN